MIEHIEKRNGTLEDFQASKVNKWGIWAAKTLGSDVDWGSIVIEAVNRCPKICTSLMLQQTLIDVCLSRKTWEYNKMAGRLYSPLIDRLLYPDGRPTVKELHQKLFDANIMVKLNYTDEEYEQSEKIIDHKMNLKYPHYQLNQIRFKYSLRNKVTKQEYESAQFVFMRMAMALAENETTDKMVHVQKYYEHFSHGRINAPTPYYVNLGTKLNGYASCCLYTTDDTAQSLAAGDHIAYMMTCMSAGIGTHIKTRSIGDPIRGGIIQHQGKLPYYRAMVGAIGANLQNGRGGASTVYYTAYDPEVEVIQKLRHPTTPITKRIAGCHYSFGTNKFFARKAAKNEMYAPFSYGDQPELYEAQYDADQSKFEELYSEYEKNAKVKLNAREVLINSLQQSYETGVQYLHMTDTINVHTPFKDKIYSSNLCFTGDTLVAVADGRNAVSIEQLAQESNGSIKFPVYSSRNKKNSIGWTTEIKLAIAFKTGEKHVVKVTLSDGSTFECTPDHRLALPNGTYKEAKDCVGLELEPFYTSIGKTRKYRHINSNSNGHSKQHIMMWKFNNGDIPNDHHIDHIENIPDDSMGNLQLMHRKDHFKKTGNEFSGENNAVFKIVDKEANHQNMIRCTTLSGNGRYLGLSNLDIYNLAVELKNSGKTLSHKNLLLMNDTMPKKFSKNRFGGKFSNLVNDVNNNNPPKEYVQQDYIVPNKGEMFSVKSISVVSIEDVGVKPVYDLTVDDNHNFNIITKSLDNNHLNCSGILVHNCSEAIMSTTSYKSVEDLYKKEYEEGDGEIALCNLAGIVPANVESDEQYADVAYYCLKMIDIAIHKSDYVFPSLDHTAKSRLSAGVGIIGLAHLMAKNNQKYDNQEGRNFIHEVAETHMWHLINASLKLSKELGVAPWMHKTKWVDGWLPVDTYEKKVDELVTTSNKRDWESKRQEIIANKGIRNTVLVMHMPAESSSLGSGTANGLYPIRELYIMKTNDTQVNHWAAPDGTKLKNKYQSAWDISTTDMIKVYSIVQKWTDQGISGDLFVKIHGTDKVSSSDMIKDYLDMVKYGMKTRYYVNSNTSKGVDLTTEESAIVSAEILEEPEYCESCTL